MRKITLAALALAGSAGLVVVTTVPASAATTAETPVTVTVAAGVLSITAPATAALSTGVPGADSTVTLTATDVTDERAGTTNWTATVSLPALTGNAVDSTETIPTTGATYLADTATLTGSPTLADPTLKTDLSTAAQTSQATTAVSGNNSASWTATLTVPIPDQVLADTYSGVMTQSVS
jgi:hypothetical protein